MANKQPSLKIIIEQTAELTKGKANQSTLKITATPCNSHVENPNGISIHVEPSNGLNRISYLGKTKDNYLFSISPKDGELERIRDINISATLKDNGGSICRVNKSYNALL